MKLNLLFIAMDVLTALAYPVVFVHTKLRQFFKSIVGIGLAHFFLTGSGLPSR